MRSALLLPLLLVACQKAPKADATPVASASAIASASAAPARAWYEGAWQGSFQAELRRIEVAPGGVKEWKSDDGKHASGPGTLKLSVSADGTVDGTASGALGELLVTGHANGDRLALTLTPAEPDGFHGFAVASQTADGLQGTLNASSADSLQARQAKLTLSRAP